MKEEREADAPIGPCQRLAALRKARALDGLTQHLARTAVGAQALSGRCRIAGPQRVLIAQPNRIQLQRSGDAIHVHFDRKLRLRRAEPAKRAVRRRVGHHRPAADPDVVAAVRP